MTEPNEQYAYFTITGAASLEDHIGDVIDQMNTRASNFVDISATYGGVMQLVAYFNCAYPGLHFSANLIGSLSAFSLSVDFDFYYLYSDRREDSE